MSLFSKLIAIAFGICLAVVGLAVLFSDGLTLPTRWPPEAFHFSGLSLLLLGASPVVLGLTSLALAFQALHRDSRSTWWAIGVSMGMLGLAFLLAPKF